MNNLHKIIATKDIYFIYIDKKVSKKLINKIVVTSSSYGSRLFLLKLLCFRELRQSNKVVSRFTTLFSLYYTILLFIYLLNISYYLTITNYILLCFNTLSVGSSIFFLLVHPTTLLFFCSKTVLHRWFFTGFAPVVHRLYWFFTGCTGLHRFLVKNRKKSDNFLQFFLPVYQQVRRNLKK